ncbi:hypothetical protein Bca52824_020931 [Brassica carinata]|uniref:Uncharacterized protein n=1 Tax=Brassica carinata TaxID=52824 RepID=A0A8X7VUL8_BRACI|nr:hypothetical protein Bca52824_020931 [Brassica carinata]
MASSVDVPATIQEDDEVVAKSFLGEVSSSTTKSTLIIRGGTWMKTLDLVFDECVIVILDDQCSSWWRDHTNHLLQIMTYRLFQKTHHEWIIVCKYS